MNGIQILPNVEQFLGVVLGDCLSSTLFIFIADLTQTLREASASFSFLIYTDDLAFYSDDPLAIQKVLNALR